MAKFGKWIGGGLGWAVGGPIGAIFGFVIGSMVDGPGKKQHSQSLFNRPGSSSTGGYVSSLLVLVAAIMKADGKILKSELEYVKKFFIHNFGLASANEAITILHDILKQEIPVTEVCLQIKQNMNYSSRLQLVHFLFGIANADGHVDERELKLIVHICLTMGINAPDIDSIKAMFVKDNGHAYQILEISRDATDEDIKKAYRRMAMKYHPDKVSYLGDDFQKTAKEKFQKVGEAYEQIKKERRIA